MPFLTEELWHAVYDGVPPSKSIALTSYPRLGVKELEEFENEVTQAGTNLEYGYIQSLIFRIRSWRKTVEVPDKELVPIIVRPLKDREKVRKTFTDNQDVIKKLAGVSEIVVNDSAFQKMELHGLYFDLTVPYERTIDVPAERERLTKEIAKYEKGLTAAERQLGNESFLAKAPAHVVEGLKKQESETRALLEKARSALAMLPTN
jgi:valyl-tRNA synthetase